jgi:plastocyanin
MNCFLKNNFPAAAAVILLCLGLTPSSHAASATVLVGASGLTFTPATTNIAAGDQIIWVWGGLNHSTTSDTAGLWDSGVTNAPYSYTNQFNSTGTFPYHCTIHGGPPFNMRGSIIVTAANSPPSVSITNPASGAVLSAPAGVTITAVASDSDGTVTNVQFLVGSTVLANVTAPLFSAVTNNLAAGSYTLSAVAADNHGAKSTNAVTISVVTPLSIAINAPQISSTNFQFSYTANPGLNYVVQCSTNLAASNWIAIFTNLAASNPVVFVDDHATNNPAFYRVGRLPNP